MNYYPYFKTNPRKCASNYFSKFKLLQVKWLNRIFTERNYYNTKKKKEIKRENSKNIEKE